MNFITINYEYNIITIKRHIKRECDYVSKTIHKYYKYIFITIILNLKWPQKPRPLYFTFIKNIIKSF